MLEKTLESPLDRKEIQPVNPRGSQPWLFTGRTDAEAEAPILWPPHAKSRLTGKNWCWERLRVGGEGSDRGWDGWIVSPSQRTWIYADSRRQWNTEKPGVLQSMGSQRVGHDLATEQQQLLLLGKANYSALTLSSTVSYLIFGHQQFQSPCSVQSTTYLIEPSDWACWLPLLGARFASYWAVMWYSWDLLNALTTWDILWEL